MYTSARACVRANAGPNNYCTIGSSVAAKREGDELRVLDCLKPPKHMHNIMEENIHAFEC